MVVETSLGYGRTGLFVNQILDFNKQGLEDLCRIGSDKSYRQQSRCVFDWETSYHVIVQMSLTRLRFFLSLSIVQGNGIRNSSSGLPRKPVLTFWSKYLTPYAIRRSYECGHNRPYRQFSGPPSWIADLVQGIQPCYLHLISLRSFRLTVELHSYEDMFETNDFTRIVEAFFVNQAVRIYVLHRSYYSLKRDQFIRMSQLSGLNHRSRRISLWAGSTI
jgi:hypothetical protein